jgi:mono/diheme cytochrome c family protein
MKKYILIALIASVAACSKKATPKVASTMPAVVQQQAQTAVSQPTNATGVNVPAGQESRGTATTTTEGSGRTKPFSQAQLGQQTYNVKCGKCHELKVANNYTKNRWDVVMKVMAPKAKLTQEETDNVLAYVWENAKR